MRKAINRLSWIILIFITGTGCSGTKETSQPSTTTPDAWTVLFDGAGTEGWEMTGPGSFTLSEDGSLTSQGGMGLFYFKDLMLKDFVLELEWKSTSETANSGVFVRFPDAPDPWYAVNTGYEIQIDDSQKPVHQTGAIYSFSAPFHVASKPVGEWNHYKIKVTGQRYQVYLNGEQVNDFYGDRSLEGMIGLQNHDDNSIVSFRNIRIKSLGDTGAPASLAEHFAVEEERDPINVLMISTTHGFRHEQAIDRSKEVMEALETTTEFNFDVTEDLSLLTEENLSKYDLLFFANSTLRLKSKANKIEPFATSSVFGDFGTWEFAISSPQGTFNGRVGISSVEDGYEGNIEFVQFPGVTPLSDIKVDGDDLSFSWDTDDFGTIVSETKMDGDELAGMINVQGGQLELKGMKVTQEVTGSVADNQTTEPQILVSETQQDVIMDFLAQGKGVIGAHSALDAFYDWEDYKKMVGGGLFEAHPWTQSVRVLVEEKDNPAVAHFGDSFTIRDEIYVLDENPRWNSKVLLSLDMDSVEPQGDSHGNYRNDYPMSWMREHNGGKVFYTKLGHFADVWTTPDFVQHLLQGMRMAAGRIESDFSGHLIKETIADNVWPDDIAVDDEGNVWIAELTGKVHRYDAASGETALVAELSTTDPKNIEHGLYGIEVDPDFYSGEPYVYLFYAERESIINTLSRFKYEHGAIDLSSEEVILRVPTEPQCCHQAGDIDWGPDGTLYLSTGDTGMSETRPDWELTEEELDAFKTTHNLEEYQWSRLVDSERTAQNLQDLRGKILRINKDGTIPKDNPFYGKAGARWEIYAYGLRNPYRFKVDQKNGNVYIGVVGPDAQFDYDEYNISTKGGENFGWPREIGRLVYNEWTPDMIPNYTPPFWEYTYETGGRSASGGPIYRHTGKGAFPPAFQDKIFIYDWARSWIKYGKLVEETIVLEKKNGETYEMTAPRLVDVKTFDILKGTRPISMELGPDGALYVAEFTGFWYAAPGSKVTRYKWVSNNGK